LLQGKDLVFNGPLVSLKIPKTLVQLSDTKQPPTQPQQQQQIAHREYKGKQRMKRKSFVTRSSAARRTPEELPHACHSIPSKSQVRWFTSEQPQSQVSNVLKELEN
jgi:hypothetical protein